MTATMAGLDRRPHDAFRGGRRGCLVFSNQTPKETNMQWIDPAYCDIRLGFEVTAYVYVR